MNRAWVLWLIAACGAKAAPHPVARVVPTPDAAVVVAPPTMIEHGPLRTKIEGHLAGVITALATVAEGDAALTIDALGEVHLWPTLDGKREPCLVDISDVHEPVIAHHGEGFVMASLDGASDLVLGVLDDQGRRLRHLSIGRDAKFLGVVMTPAGILAWSEDQTINLYTFDGALVGHLGTDPGQRFRDVVANGTHVLGEFELDQEHVILRELVMQPHLAWGPPIETEGLPQGPFAISPSGTRFAVLVKEPKVSTLTIHAFDRATGQALARAIVPGLAELGFIDDRHLGAVRSDGVTWFELAPAFKTETFAPGTALSEPERRKIAFGSGVVVRTVNSSLTITRPGGEKYLGYGMSSATLATLGPNGQVVLGEGDATVQLDRNLAEVPGAPSLPAGSILTDLVWLGGSEYLANLANLDDGRDEDLSFELLSGDHAPIPVALAAASPSDPKQLGGSLPRHVTMLRYQPTTRLLVVSLWGQPRVERWVPAQHKLEHVAVLPRPAAGEARLVFPVDPALAEGVELVDMRFGPSSSIRWTDATAKKQLATAETLGLLAVDPAGRTYAWIKTDTGTELAVLVRGKVIAVLPHPPQFTVWPDPRGTGALELAKDHVALVHLDGTVGWERPLLGSVRAFWTDDELVIVTTTGVARLDLKTGARLGARCGWHFGLSDKPQLPSPAVESICAMR